MKSNLSCCVVRDLLPSYIEGLTEKDTENAVREHLDSCPECSEIYNNMSDGEKTQEQETKQVDFLKKIRKSGRRKIVLASLIAAVSVLVIAFVGVLSYFLYYDAFTAVDADKISEKYKVNDFLKIEPEIRFSDEKNMFMRVHVREYLSDYAIKDIIVDESDQFHADIKVTLVRARPDNRDVNTKSVDILMDGPRDIRMYDNVLFDKWGFLVDMSTNNLFSKKTPSVKDEGSFNALLYYVLNDFDNQYADYNDYEDGSRHHLFPAVRNNYDIDTSSEPYTAKINYHWDISRKNRDIMDERSMLIFALAGDLKKINWYDHDGLVYTVTIEEAEKEFSKRLMEYREETKLEAPIKTLREYTTDADELNYMRNIIGI